jgi:anti-sigma B factor antagonist
MNNNTATPSGDRVRMERHEDAWVVVLQGEHDLETVAAVREQITDARLAAGVIVVDLTAATFIDSTVLGVLLDAYQADTPPRLRFIAPAETPPRRLFDFVGFDMVIPIFERLQDALAYKALG